MNAVGYNAELDQIAISVRRFDEIWIIDHSCTEEEARGPEGDLLYRFGNALAYGMGRWSERRFLGQHNVQWIPEGRLGAGNLMVFNDGPRPRSWSAIVEWAPPMDQNGRYLRLPFGPSQYEWTYVANDIRSFFGRFISAVLRLSNGNTLICDGSDGRVFEVTQEAETVWDWQNDSEPFGVEVDPEEEDPFKVALFRAERYAADSPAIQALRAAGVPIPDLPGDAPSLKEDPKPEEGDE